MKIIEETSVKALNSLSANIQDKKYPSANKVINVLFKLKSIIRFLMLLHISLSIISVLF